MRVQRSLDTAHHTDGLRTKLLLERSLFAQSNAMLTRTGSFHLKGSIDHVVNDFLDPFSLCWVMAVVHNAGVEVSIANVSKNTGKDTQAVQLLFGDFYYRIS